MFIEQPPLWFRWIYPDALWRLDKKHRAVFLTFDDGPVPDVTPRVLEILDHYHVKATFFMVGDNVRKYPHLYERIKAEGHQVGNHTYNHMGSVRHTLKTYVKNTNKANELIHSRYFRPPHGWMRPAAYIWLKRKYKVVMWDVVTRDYSRLLTAEDVVNNIKTYTRNGSIITFHDSLKSIDKLYTALPESLEWLISQGYKFKIFK
jgi:peptidoglycan/xylan/chitin deacetylase (PgdA/CDA1 family)